MRSNLLTLLLIFALIGNSSNICYSKVNKCSIEKEARSSKSKKQEKKKTKKLGYMWLAAINSVSFMKIKNFDIDSGVINTECYESEEYPNEKYSLTIVIYSGKMEISNISVSLQKQIFKDGRWMDAEFDPFIEYEIALTIVRNARILAANR